MSELKNKIFKGPNDLDYAVIKLKPSKIEYCSPRSFKPEVWTK